MTTEQCLFYLISCAINEREPDDRLLRGQDLSRVLSLARKHSVFNLAYFGCKSSRIFREKNKELFEECKAKIYQNIRREMLMYVEQKEVCLELEEKGIWYCLLKSSVVREMYPTVFMRQMADCDILIDKSKRREVREIMVGKGYECANYEKCNRDAYYKEPLYNYEMYADLFSKEDYPDIASEFVDIEKKLIPISAESSEHVLSPEDMYVYLLADAYVHFYSSGTGIRSLVDLYVYRKTYMKQLEHDYVKKELERVKLVDFEGKICALMTNMFN